MVLLSYHNYILRRKYISPTTLYTLQDPHFHFRQYVAVQTVKLLAVIVIHNLFITKVENEAAGGDYDYEDDFDEYDDDEDEDDGGGSSDGESGDAEDDGSKKKGGGEDASTSENLSYLQDGIAPQQSVLHMTQAVCDIDAFYNTLRFVVCILFTSLFCFWI